ncbi:2-hydroxy-3-oxopropionate reductase [Siminovitchia terrae]|uniref:2-hydroxy-3-oxopropionate reductase n=1 Tax=Siminovitchia terrae TaxID=1914933 RepID=A0A429X552_SIMTE|nr:NAD(P)-dependent oxidoreductase [Siminovitchia terrae]RST58555.1 NAD(P)-dependent oxidoreductase [Siminovitchia terrae]GIN95262.1 2-hydroxy-3-oxopropionate reductase [Siminovitchia terrae]
MKIRIIGCGAMGSGMVKNLQRADHEVATFDPDPTKQEQMKKLGATPVSRPTAGIAETEVVLLSLPTSSMVWETVIGKEGILSYLSEGAYILDMSTTDVEMTKHLARSAKEKGVDYLDCPVSNGPTGANDGTLTIMVGGEKEAFDAMLPVLSAIGKEVRYIGPSGSGQVVKLCNNMMVAGITALLSETFLTGAKNGVDPKKIAELMAIGSAQTKVLSVFGPNLIDDTHNEVKFLLSHMAKDINLYMDMTKKAESPALIGSLVAQLYEAAKRQGLGHLDTSAVGQVVEWMGNHKISV